MKTNHELIAKLNIATNIHNLKQLPVIGFHHNRNGSYKSFVLNSKGAYVLTLQPYVTKIPATPWESLLIIYKELKDMEPEDMTTAEKNIWNNLYALGIAKNRV